VLSPVLGERRDAEEEHRDAVQLAQDHHVVQRDDERQADEAERAQPRDHDRVQACIAARAAISGGRRVEVEGGFQASRLRRAIPATRPSPQEVEAVSRRAQTILAFCTRVTRCGQAQNPPPAQRAARHLKARRASPRTARVSVAKPGFRRRGAAPSRGGGVMEPPKADRNDVCAGGQRTARHL